MVTDDFPPGVEQVPEEQAKKAGHDVPGEPSEAQNQELKHQLEDERIHGHPALKEKP